MVVFHGTSKFNRNDFKLYGDATWYHFNVLRHQKTVTLVSIKLNSDSLFDISQLLFKIFLLVYK